VLLPSIEDISWVLLSSRCAVCVDSFAATLRHGSRRCRPRISETQVLYVTQEYICTLRLCHTEMLARIFPSLFIQNREHFKYPYIYIYVHIYINWFRLTWDVSEDACEQNVLFIHPGREMIIYQIDVLWRVFCGTILIEWKLFDVDGIVSISHFIKTKGNTQHYMAFTSWAGPWLTYFCINSNTIILL
jgi:hypothetical protein